MFTQVLVNIFILYFFPPKAEPELYFGRLQTGVASIIGVTKLGLLQYVRLFHVKQKDFILNSIRETKLNVE